MQTTPRDLMTKVYTGYFTRRVNSLYFLNQAFGSQALSTLTVMEDQPKPAALKYIAENFGLDGEYIIDKYWHYEHGGMITILDGIEIQCLSEAKMTGIRNSVHHY